MPKRRVKRHSVTQPCDESYRLIPLTQGQNAIVDTADFEWLSQWNWFAYWDRATKSFYAGRQIANRLTGMHRVILGCKSGAQADHKNHDTLDNRRRNLRNCISSQNARNRRPSTNPTGFKGVNPSGKRWRAKIRANQKQIYLGFYDTVEEAARAYDDAASIYFGEFAHLNFPLHHCDKLK